MKRNAAVLMVLMALAGCAGKGATVSPYYVVIPDDGTTTTKTGRLYFGQCPVHGRLTNSVPRDDRVGAATYAHNKKYHSDGTDMTWAKVFRED